MHGGVELVGEGGAAATPAVPTARQLVHLGSAKLQGAVDPDMQPLCLHAQYRRDAMSVCHWSLCEIRPQIRRAECPQRYNAMCCWACMVLMHGAVDYVLYSVHERGYLLGRMGGYSWVVAPAWNFRPFQ